MNAKVHASKMSILLVLKCKIRKGTMFCWSTKIISRRKAQIKLKGDAIKQGMEVGHRTRSKQRHSYWPRHLSGFISENISGGTATPSIRVAHVSEPLLRKSTVQANLEAANSRTFAAVEISSRTNEPLHHCFEHAAIYPFYMRCFEGFSPMHDLRFILALHSNGIYTETIKIKFALSNLQ